MKAVIIDLDGICFDPTERLKRCKKEDGTIDWNKAFSPEQIVCDPVIEHSEHATWKIWEWYKIVYLTGRSNIARAANMISLFVNNDFAPGMLCMRKENDLRPDHQLKAEGIDFLKENYKMNFVAAIDDDYNGKLKPMYELLGIPCFLTFEIFFRSELWLKSICEEKHNCR